MLTSAGRSVLNLRALRSQPARMRRMYTSWCDHVVTQEGAACGGFWRAKGLSATAAKEQCRKAAARTPAPRAALPLVRHPPAQSSGPRAAAAP